MLHCLRVEALLADAVLADAIWEVWSVELTTDETAAAMWAVGPGDPLIVTPKFNLSRPTGRWGSNSRPPPANVTSNNLNKDVHSPLGYGVGSTIDNFLAFESQRQRSALGQGSPSQCC